MVDPSLAVIEYSATASGLAGLRARLANVVYDVTTGAGMDVAKKARRELVTLRTDLDKLRKQIKEPALERCRLIDAEAARITAAIVELEAPIDAVIKAEETRKALDKAAREQAERERLALINQRIDWIRGQIVEAVGKPADAIAEMVADIAQLPITEDLYGELVPIASQARMATGDKLTALLVAAQGAEAQAEANAVLARALAAQKEKQDTELAAERSRLAAIELEQAAERKRIADVAAAARAGQEAKDAADRAEREAADAAQAEIAAELARAQAAERAAQAATAKAQEEAAAAQRRAVEQAEANAKAQAQYEAELAAARRENHTEALRAVAAVAADLTVTDAFARDAILLLCEANL